jgi:hypothetical protein
MKHGKSPTVLFGLGAPETHRVAPKSLEINDWQAGGDMLQRTSASNRRRTDESELE